MGKLSEKIRTVSLIPKLPGTFRLAMNVEQIFARAVEIDDNNLQRDFLNNACGSDDELRGRVCELLEAHHAGNCILDAPAEQFFESRQASAGMKTLGDFDLIREIGRGGMGIVYEARQRSLDRRVALKVLARGVGLSEKAIVRFRREAEAAAKLHHTNVVPIYQTGEEDGSYYYAMELIEGPSLEHVVEYMKVSASQVKSDFKLKDQDKHAESKERPSWAADTVGVHCSTINRRDAESSAISAVGKSGDLQRFDRLAEMIADAADALHHAHQNGVIHRDIKPANLLLAPDGRLSITDFGLARMLERPGMTLTGEFMGTPRYMSPEQIVSGRVPIDHRTDIYSLGATMYEMLTLQPAFVSRNREQVLSEILHKDPKLLRRSNRAIPKDLEAICLKAMQKDPDARYQTAKEMAEDLRRYIRRDIVHAKKITVFGLTAKFVHRHQLAIGIACCILILASAATFFAWRNRDLEKEVGTATVVATVEVELRQRQNNARRQLPKIQELIDNGRYVTALRLANQASVSLPDDPALQELMDSFTLNINLKETTPPGGKVSIRDWNDPRGEWLDLGVPPLTSVRVPIKEIRWKFEVEGRRALEMQRPGLGGGLSSVRIYVPDRETCPDDMAYIFAGRTAHGKRLGQYLIDRFEVTNEQFHEFVNQGGYENPTFWTEPFFRNGEQVPFEHAIKSFVDQTKVAGPATWKNGRYPANQAKYPVRGVSWYEAKAFAEYAGKSLPTVYHWAGASRLESSQSVLPISNFMGEGPAPVGTFDGIGLFDIYDTAGNVKEWCSNPARDGQRHIRGGAWNDPDYMYGLLDAAAPFDRDPTFGFRCAKYIDPPSEDLVALVEIKHRDIESETVATDEEINSFRRLYHYDSSPLNADVREAKSSVAGVRHEVARIDAAYVGERFDVHLFLPTNQTRRDAGLPTIVYFCGTGALRRESVTDPDYDSNLRESFLKQGFAVCLPVIKGTFNRRLPGSPPLWHPSASGRDLYIQIAKDFFRTIDFLETREDLDSESIVFLGLSWGAGMSPIVLANEPRIAAAVLVAGGLRNRPILPEVEPLHFLPLIKKPTLIMNGRYDELNQYQLEQLPFYQRIGATDKKLQLYDTGHLPEPDVIAEDAKAWLSSRINRPQAD